MSVHPTKSGGRVIYEDGHYLKCRIELDAAGRVVSCTDVEIRTPRGSVKPPPALVPLDMWPAWASVVASQRKEGEDGVGDTMARILGTPGLVAQAALKAMGVPCRCKHRQGEFNIKYNYRVYLPTGAAGLLPTDPPSE